MFRKSSRNDILRIQKKPLFEKPLSNKIDAVSRDSRVLASMLSVGCFNLRTDDTSSLQHQPDDVANISFVPQSSSGKTLYSVARSPIS